MERAVEVSANTVLDRLRLLVGAGGDDHVTVPRRVRDERLELREGDEVVVEREDAVVAAGEFDEHVGFGCSRASESWWVKSSIRRYRHVRQCTVPARRRCR